MCRAPVYRPAIFCFRCQHCTAHNARLFWRIDLRDVDPRQALTSDLKHHLKLEQCNCELAPRMVWFGLVCWSAPVLFPLFPVAEWGKLRCHRHHHRVVKHCMVDWCLFHRALFHRGLPLLIAVAWALWSEHLTLVGSFSPLCWHIPPGNWYPVSWCWTHTCTNTYTCNGSPVSGFVLALLCLDSFSFPQCWCRSYLQWDSFERAT